MEIETAWRRKYRIRLETERFVLRPLVEEDVDWLAALFANDRVNRFLMDNATTLEKARQGAEAVISLDLMRGRFGQWAILDKATGAVHGWTELSKLRPWHGPSDEIALSYVLGPESWGRGIATEAAGRLLRHAFEVLELDRVMAVIMADHIASSRVLEKLGMRPAANGELVDGRKIEYFYLDHPFDPPDRPFRS